MQTRTKHRLILLAVTAAIVAVGAYTSKHNSIETTGDYATHSVKILASSLRSGGTGVILSSSPAGTDILTNKHVCQLIQVGGVVQTDNDNNYPVTSFQVYTKHDLCLIHITADLHKSVVVAESAPKIYTQDIISGHPSLLPSMVTVGHFSKTMPIQLVVAMRACDGTEKGQEALICMLAGGKPVIREFDATVTSALIMAGSSGSGVFNSRGELSGLVFAGSQGLSYSFIVPHSYVKDFLTNIASYPIQKPDEKKTPESFFAKYAKFRSTCVLHPELTTICKSSLNYEIFYE